MLFVVVCRVVRGVPFSAILTVGQAVRGWSGRLFSWPRVYLTVKVYKNAMTRTRMNQKSAVELQYLLALVLLYKTEERQ